MKAFFEALGHLVDPGRADLIEKDYYLHILLHRIARENHLKENMVFKGGTCLIKAYLGYYRFSEDLDFTWKDPAIWVGKSPSRIRKACSGQIDVLLEIFTRISHELGFRFEGEKGNQDEVIIGSGGRMVRFFLGYHSEILNIPSRIKVELNFVDKIIFPFRSRNLRSYIEDLDSERIRFLFNEPYQKYTSKIAVECYDPREIFIEKCRALMTRMAYKYRDAIDIYMLQEQYGYRIPEHSDSIIEKTRFMLDLYKKYRENIQAMTLPPPGVHRDGEMKYMASKPSSDIRDGIRKIHEEILRIRKMMAADERQA